ncbi:hypothetical protein SKAU_G00395210 [Synaphobranchus kaupii]|uniref:Uncharacterized protein n=1 Tax=Synaphobranchus kaupii TaxID=118154 RepID=A0A9Q1IBZ7_SYNKA|nr:hypothetical protein SKAU_G00395210 [Synaphobranchus kaupii]
MGTRSRHRRQETKGVTDKDGAHCLPLKTNPTPPSSPGRRRVHKGQDSLWLTTADPPSRKSAGPPRCGTERLTALRGTERDSRLVGVRRMREMQSDAALLERAVCSPLSMQSLR